MYEEEPRRREGHTRRVEVVQVTVVNLHRSPDHRFCDPRVEVCLTSFRAQNIIEGGAVHDKKIKNMHFTFCASNL